MIALNRRDKAKTFGISIVFGRVIQQNETIVGAFVEGVVKEKCNSSNQAIQGLAMITSISCVESKNISDFAYEVAKWKKPQITLGVKNFNLENPYFPCSHNHVTPEPVEDSSAGVSAYASLPGDKIKIIMRKETEKLGITLSGNSDRKKMGCFVCGIDPNGQLAKENIQYGDELLEVNGKRVFGRTHFYAANLLLTSTEDEVDLILLRKKGPSSTAVPKITRFTKEIIAEFTTDIANAKTIKIFKENQSFGIMIIEGKHQEHGKGIFISDIKEGSSAQENGLQMGDMILAINDEDIKGFSYDEVTSIFKRTEIVMKLVVIQKKKVAEEKKEKKEEEQKPEIPKDPKTDQIVPNAPTTIEIPINNLPLGLRLYCYVSKTQHCSIIHINDGSAAANDGRLKVFDKIIDKSGAHCTHRFSEWTNKISQASLTLQVQRDDPLKLKTISVEVRKGGGKSIGLKISSKNSHGAIVNELLPDGTAAADGRIQPGDTITKIDQLALDNLSLDEIAIMMKAISGSATLTVVRPE